jgi:hypothetical protein
LLQNDVQHGGATWARLESRGHAMRLVTDGHRFLIEELLATERPEGGHATVAAFRASFSDTHVLSHGGAPQRNAYLLTDVRHAPRAHNPCSVSAADLDPPGRPATLARLVACPEVHVYFDQKWSISLVSKQLRRLELPADTHVVLHNLRPGPMTDALIRFNSHLTLRVAGGGGATT